MNGFGLSKKLTEKGTQEEVKDNKCYLEFIFQIAKII